ncbi:MAG TPA: GNAT family N-acetyltransferase [Chloroflexota bacterium]|nr:GNAT family N-acetyltransferase [Chloroflexota bacterium]
MSQDMSDFSPAVMTRAIIDNLHHFADRVSALPGAEILPIGGSIGYFTDNPLSLFNGVVQPRFSPDTVEGAITTFQARARARGVAMSWYLPPGSEPVDLAERLLAHGFTRGEVAVGMAMRLDHLPAEPLPAGITIQRVADPALLRTWVALSAQNFSGEPVDLPTAFVESLVQVFAADGLGDHARTCAYLAALDGRPVATALVVYAGGAAGIYAVTTAPAARGRGIGRAVTLASLHAAYARGYRVGILQANSMAISVYRALGFEEYCVIPEYLWPGDPVVG